MAGAAVEVVADFEIGVEDVGVGVDVGDVEAEVETGDEVVEVTSPSSTRGIDEVAPPPKRACSKAQTLFIPVITSSTEVMLRMASWPVLSKLMQNG